MKHSDAEVALVHEKHGVIRACVFRVPRRITMKELPLTYRFKLMRRLALRLKTMGLPTEFRVRLFEPKGV